MEVLASPVEKPKCVFVDKKKKKVSIYFHFYIVGAEEYIKEIRALNNADEDTEVSIFIASNGGDLDTTVGLIEHIRNCKGKTTAYVSFACSAATAIALACDKVVVYTHGYFMVHNFSETTQGKGSELKARANFTGKWIEKLFSDVYKGFMTPEEIVKVSEDKDFWMTKEEVDRRLKNVNKL